MNINNSKYIDYKVYEVTKIKDKYGFRIKLLFADGTSTIQQKGGYNSIKEAKKERDIILGQLYSGEYIYQKKISVKDFYIFWLENDIRIRCTDNTYVSFKNTIYKHIIPSIGNVTLSLLNQGQIQKLYDKETESSNYAVRLTKNVLELGLKFALNKNLINHNPAVGVKIEKNLSYNDKKNKINKTKTLTEEQLKLLIEKSKGTSIYLQILFSSLMGLRKSEVNGIKYSDIDFINRKLKVERQLGVIANSNKEAFKKNTYTKQEIPLKTFSSKRELDIPDIVFEAILEQRKIYEKNKHRRKNDKTNPFQDLGYVCCSSYGRPRSRTYNFPHFKKLLRENNLPDIRWHDLRATYATLLLKNNFSLKAISKRMGHARPIITADVYGDKKEIIRDCTDNLNDFLTDVLPTNNNEDEKNYTELGDEINIFLDKIIDDFTINKNELKDKSDSNTISIINNISKYYLNS